MKYCIEHLDSVYLTLNCAYHCCPRYVLTIRQNGQLFREPGIDQPVPLPLERNGIIKEDENLE
jgi:hypothetical protein